MGEDELRAEIEDARTQVGTPLAPNAPRQADAPSAEPVSDIEAQILSMRAGERDGVYLSAANVENLQSQPEFVNRIAEALNSAEGAQIVQNVDGKGGIMVAANADVARNIEEAVKAGVDVQTVLGEATGAGTGKPADATAVVQQKTPEGAVTRESLVTPDQVAETEKEFAGPAKTVETVTPEQAIARREEKIAEEKQTGPMVSRVPTFQDIAEELPKDEDGLPNYQALSDRIKEIGKKGWPDLNVMEKAKLYREFAGQGTGTRAAPVTVETADDLELVSNEADSEYTPAQGEANNRKLGHAKWNGLDLSIETKAGGVRKGVDKETGKTWETTMGAAYGYIRGTSGADNMHVDAYVGTDVNSGRVFIIDEVDNKTGKFRQHKTFIGFPDEASAVAAYTGTSSKTPDMIGAVTEMSADEFRDWVLDGKKTKPLGNIEKPDFSSQAVEPEALAKPKSETIAPPARYEGEPLSEMEIDAIVGNWKYVQEVSRRPRPQSLSSYVIDNGGLRDDAREVRHIAGSAKERPGLINSQGETLDDAARSAWEAGFFTGDRPEIAEFLDALQDDLHSGKVVREQDLPAIEDLRIAEDIEQELADYGVTTNRFRSEASLREYFGQERPRTARETETDQEAQAPAKERKGRTGDVEEAPFDLPAKGEKAKPFDPYSFSVQAAYAKQGEEALKKRLADFGVDELKQIVSAQNLGVKAEVLDGSNAIALRKAIVDAAREKLANRMAAAGGTVEGALKKPGNAGVQEKPYELANDAKAFEAYVKGEQAAPEPTTNEKTADLANLPDGYSVELSSTRLKGDEARIKGGEYKAIARRQQPAGSPSVVDGYGNTPEEAMRNALRKVGYQPSVVTEKSGQTSLVPEPTTKEKIAAEAKTKEKKGGNEPMDEGLFGSSKDQLDLVDMAKQREKEPENERTASQDQEKQTGDTPDSKAYETLADLQKAVADGKVKSQPDREHRCYKFAGQKALDGGYDLVLGKVGDEKIQHGVARTLDEKYIYDPQYDVWMAADVYAQAVSGFEEEFVLSASDVQTFLDDFNVWPSMAMLEKHGWLGGEAIEESAPATSVEEPVETSETEQESEETETKPQEAVSLQDALRDHLLGEGFSTIIEARKFAKDHGFEGSTKDVDELVEQAVVAAARQVVSETGDVTAAYQALVGLYNNQPNLAVRTSTSVTNQAYSTPAPLAYLASRLAGVADASHVLEPTAGNGMLLIEADPNTVEANEIDPKRAKALRDQNFATVKSVDATDPAFTQAKSADSVIMNPPFGAVREDGQSKSWTVDGLETSAIDHAIALNALHAMTDDGKAVIIMGGVNAESIEERRKGYRGKSKRLFFAKLYKTYNVTDHFTVSGDLYKKQGAGWPVDVVVIEGRGQSERPLPASEPPVILKTWDDLKGKLPDASSSTEPIRGSKQATDADNRPAGGTDLGKRGSESGDVSGRQDAVRRGTERLPAGTEDKPAGVRADRDRGQPADVSKGVRTEPDSAAQSVRDRRTANERPASSGKPRVERTAPPEGSGQALYEPASAAQSLDTLIPVNMAQATKSALGRVEAKHGGLDAFVSEQLGYTDDLSKYFSAEQVDAIAAAIDNIERGSGYILGDQCVGGETLIFDPITGDHTPIQVLTERGEPISVLSLTNDGFAARSATSPFLKGVADLYRVTFDDGSSITVTRGHRFLTSNGWASLDAGVEVGTEIASFSPTGLLLDRAGSIHQACAREDARHSSDKAQDCLSHYSRDLHLCDERSLSAEDSDLVSAPSQGDVLEHTRCYSHRDGQDVSAECIRPRRDIDRHSKNSSSPLESRGPSLISSQEPASSEQLSAQIRQVPSPFDCDSGPLHQEDGASAIGQLAEKDRRLSSFSSTNNTAYRRVVAIQFDRHDAFFDMHVPGAFNYVANGVVNHNTGIGKGRVVAATIRYAIRKGWTPVFVTEKPDLYGDMFRDMADIGLQKMLGHEPRALMTNTGESVPLDEEALSWKQEADQARADGQPIPKRRGRFLTAGGKPAQDKAMAAIAAGKGEHDIVFTTYDQMNTIKKQETDRRRFLRQIIPNALLILDESHNAGGQGEKLFKAKHGDAPDRAEYVRGLVKGAAGVVYSSATFAKRPDVMDLYARTDMGKAVDDPKMLPALIQKGGVPMQQIVASMLSNAGQYMRRERSFEGVEYAVEPVPVDEKTYKQFSDAVRAVFEFDLAVEDIRDEVMEDILDQMGATKAKDAGVGGGSASSIAFASIMHNIVNQMLLSIKARQVAQRAIDAHKAGEKPVIALASTMESFISDYAEDAGISVGQPISISFGDVLQRYLSRTLRITVKDSENKKKHVQIPISDLPPSLQRSYAEAEQLIREGDFDSMPVSPIDAIRHALTSAGLSVAEVTGRKEMIDYGAKGNSPVLINRPKSEIGPSGKRSSIAAFNRGDLDALILNRSGSTGVSMHASKAFKDQSPRRMIIAQAEGNIDTHLQMLGRVHRTGQVIPPSYSQIAAEIPAEARPTAVLMKKMASLNANTTGARGSVFMADSIDFMNEYGDKVVANIIQDEPEINAKLGNPLKENDKGLPVSEDAARRVTGRLVLLSPKEQSELLNRIQDEYKAEIERLDALGENALEAKTVDLRAKVLDTTTLKERSGEGPFLDSSQIEKMSVKSQGRAMAPKEVAEKISEALEITQPDGEGAAQLAVLERSGREWMNKKIGDVRSRSQSWIAADVAAKSDDAKVSTKKRHDDQLSRWIQTAQVVAPGARVTLQLGDRQMHAIVLSVARTGKAKNPVALGAWTATMAVPDSVRTLTLPFSQLFPPAQAKGGEESGAEIRFSQVPFSGLISQLEDARREGREERYVVTGNILAGYDQVRGKGQIVNFTMEDGTLRPGILMSRDFQLNKFMSARTVRFKTAAQVAAFLEKAPMAEVQTSDKYVTFSRPRGEYVIETAAGRATGGQYYTDSRVRDALQGREFVRSGGIMRVTMPDRSAFTRVLDAIRKVGGIFETTSDQDLAQEIVRKSPGNEPAYAIGGRETFDEIEDKIFAGETHVVSLGAVAEQVAAIRPYLNMVPRGTIAGVLERIVPVGDSIDPLNQLVKLRYMLPNGKFATMTYKWTSIAGKRALTQAVGGRSSLLVHNLGPFLDLGKTARGEIWHEVTHILRKIAKKDVVLEGVVHDDVGLSGERWRRLLAHAKKLRVLDRVTADVLRSIGLIDDAHLSTTRTLRQDYSTEYHDRSDKVELIRQESVAHMLELWDHGVISDEDMAPVMDILEDIRSGRLAGNPPSSESSSDPTFALGKSLSDQDALGYYSALLRGAHNLKQEKGTPEQMLAQLRQQAGVKAAEIEATGLDKFLSPPPIPDQAFWNAAKPMDTALEGESGLAMDAWVGGPHNTIELGLHGGLMIPSLLENMSAAALDAMAAPVRAALRQRYGDEITVYRGEREGGKQSDGRANKLVSYTTDRSVASSFSGARSKPRKGYSEAEIVAAEKALKETGEAQIAGTTFRQDPESKYVDMYDRAGDFITDTESIRWFVEQRNAEAKEDNDKRAAAMRGIREVRIPVESVIWATDRFNQKEIIARAGAEQPAKNSVTKTEIINYLSENRVELIEVIYRGKEVAITEGMGGGVIDDETMIDLFGEPEPIIIQETPVGAQGPTKWSAQSVDPSNPTYSETVLHLPSNTDQGVEIPNTAGGWGNIDLNGATMRNPEYDRVNFTSGHWSEPNVVAHTRTQILTDANGRKVFNIDELQSDWAQAIRDKGAREEEKIASLKARKDQLDNQIVSLRPLAVRDAKRIDQSGIDREFIIRDWEIESDLGLKYGLEDWSAAGVEIGENAKAFIDAMDEKHLVEAEIPTTESAPINHPLVSTTDQWTATALRRVIRMAVEAGADAISITPASEQKARYRLSNKIGALRYDPEMKRLEYREVKDGRIDAYYSRFDNDGKPVEKADLPNIVGKEVAERLLAEPRAYVSAAYSVAGPHTLTELGEIGGTGMSATYDVMYPRALGKLLAKIDPSIKPEKRTLRKANGREIEQRMSASEAIKQGFDRIPALDFTVFPITDKVRSQVLDDGQTLFAIGGRADPVVRYLRWAENAKPATLSITDKAGKSYRFERRPVGNGSIYYRVFDGSKEVASFYVRTGGAVFDSISVMNAKVDENYQRRGIASAAYDAIEADTAPGGLPLYPQGSLSMSQDALAFWRARNPDRLAEMRDTEIQPFGRTVASIYASKVDATSKDQIETAIQDALEIVGRIAGRNINVDLKPTIPVGAALDASSRADLEASGQDLPETAGGYYKTVRNGATGVIEGPHVIGLAFEDPRFDLRTTAGHEAWHHVETALSTPQEMRLLQSPAEMARMTRLAAKEAGRSTAETSRLPAYEIRALAFQNYRRMREEGAAELSGLHIGVRRFFERIAKTLAAIRNALKGMGYASFEDIFERARTGETAARADRQEAETKEQQLEQAVKSAMQSSSNNNPDPAATINAFIDQRMARDDGNAASQVQAYHAYSLWADEAGLELPTIEEFDKAMLRQGVRRMVLANDDVRYIGLRVVEEAEEKPANPSAKIEKDAFQIAKELALGMSIEGAIEKQIEKVKSVIGEKPDFARLALLQTLKANDNANENIHQNIISMGSVMPRMPSNPLRGTLQRRALRMLARVANISDAARVRIQDKALPIRRLAVERVENETGAAVPVSLDTYISEGLYHGRAGERLNDLKQDRIEPLLEHMRASGLTLESVGDYLYARHAFERNDAIRQIDPDNDAGSGMTDEEAATILDRVYQSGKQADMDTAVRMVDTIIDDARNTLLRSGLIDRTTYDTWREKYPNYAPLRGFDLGEDENPDRPRAGRGFDLRGPESRQALGRRSKADNPLVYTIMQAEEAIIRAEKNRVAKTLYKMIQANPNPVVWELYRGEAKRRVNPSTGLVETYWVHPPFVRNDAVHGVKINGKQFWMELKHPALARAMRGVGSEWNGSIIGRAMMTLTRTYASLLTSYNPEFVVSNFFRDLETSLMNVSDVANKPAGLRRKILKDATSLKSIRGALAAVRDHEGRTIFGTHRRADENILGLPKSAAAQEYARWYDEFRLAGGKISFMEFNDVERIKHRINADLKAGRMKRALRGAAEYVENLNTAVENGVRLSTYVALRRAGIEQDRAAFTARELTVNFNRRGEWGPAINSMYLFFNASVQGSTRVAQAFVKSKAVRYGVASIFAAGMALDLFNFLAAGDDDDGENKYDAIPEWIKDRNIVIMNPFGDDYIMIPMAYGYNVPYVAGLKATEMLRGKTSPLQAAASVAGQLVDSFNPMGTAERFYQLVSPTIIDPAVQVLENKTWYGGPIYPTKYDKRKPESENYFTSAPWWAIDMAKTLNSVTGGNHRRSGWFDVSPEVIEHYAEFAGGGVAKFIGNAMNSGERLVNGDEWLPEKTPLLRRVYGKPTSEGRKRDFYELWDDANRAKYEAQSDDKEVAEAAREKYAAELRVYGAAKGAKETLKALRAQRDKIRADNKLDHDERQAKLNDIIEREKALISRVLKLYRDAKSQQTEKESTP